MEDIDHIKMWICSIVISLLISIVFNWSLVERIYNLEKLHENICIECGHEKH